MAFALSNQQNAAAATTYPIIIIIVIVISTSCESSHTKQPNKTYVLCLACDSPANRTYQSSRYYYYYCSLRRTLRPAVSVSRTTTEKTTRTFKFPVRRTTGTICGGTEQRRRTSTSQRRISHRKKLKNKSVFKCLCFILRCLLVQADSSIC